MTWNLVTGECVDVVPTDVKRYHRFTDGTHIDCERLSLDRTGRYLVYSKDNHWIIRDIIDKRTMLKRQIGENPQRRTDTAQHFFGDDQIVLLTPTRIDPEHGPVWCRRSNDGAWQPVPIKIGNGALEGNFVIFTDTMMVTDYPTTSATKQPTWLPEIAGGGRRNFMLLVAPVIIFRIGMVKLASWSVSFVSMSR